ncbi:MAG: 3-oxoacyl-ACP synthase III, partial [Opitutales bacterium]
MRFSKVCIESLAWVQPPVELTSDDIERRLAPAYERLHLPEGRLVLMTGIVSRHFWGKPVMASWASAQAGAKLLQKTRIPKERIGLL